MSSILFSPVDVAISTINAMRTDAGIMSFCQKYGSAALSQPNIQQIGLINNNILQCQLNNLSTTSGNIGVQQDFSDVLYSFVKSAWESCKNIGSQLGSLIQTSLQSITLEAGCIMFTIVILTVAGGVLIAIGTYNDNPATVALGVSCLTAAVGAALGTAILPGVGTAVGAVIGWGIGYLTASRTVTVYHTIRSP